MYQTEAPVIDRSSRANRLATLARHLLLLTTCLTFTAACSPDAEPTPTMQEEMGVAPQPDLSELPPDAGRDMAQDAAPEAVDLSMPDAAPDLSEMGGEELPDLVMMPPDHSWQGPPRDRPLSILFIGNSFTLYGPVPTLFGQLAVDAGWPTPDVVYSAFGGESLSGHRQREATVSKVDRGGWDVVVLQEYSTKPTDNLGKPEEFKQDATWFYDRIKQSSPEAHVFLYETWARHPEHAYYPDKFDDPAQMQAQLRTHYNDAVNTYIPTHATFEDPYDVTLAPVGDAWEIYLMRPDAVQLHDTDLYHPGAAGQYLNAAMLFSAIYLHGTRGLRPLKGISPEVAAALQEVIDGMLGHEPGALPPTLDETLEVGHALRLDLGVADGQTPEWNNLTDASSGRVLRARDDMAEETSVSIVVGDGFSGTNTNGVSANGLGWPASVTRDTFWVGSFDGHEAALAARGVLTFTNLDPDGRYDLSLFGSRTGDDQGAGRLTRYTVQGSFKELEASDNANGLATFTSLQPDEAGRLTLTVQVSPEGRGRFAYLNALELRRAQ